MYVNLVFKLLVNIGSEDLDDWHRRRQAMLSVPYTSPTRTQNLLPGIKVISRIFGFIGMTVLSATKDSLKAGNQGLQHEPLERLMPKPGRML